MRPNATTALPIKPAPWCSPTTFSVDFGSHCEPKSMGNAVDSTVDACPCRRTGFHFAGTCFRQEREARLRADVPAHPRRSCGQDVDIPEARARRVVRSDQDISPHAETVLRAKAGSRIFATKFSTLS